ncbi:hypothetical protein D6D17_07037 [Aureobasidium pullulans]|nr:hypothetical protein D6D17_07037 [Aureobasidium pullulans]
MASLAIGNTPQVILLAVIALSARFSTHAYFGTIDPRARGTEYMKRAAQLLDPSDVSLTGIQVCVLLGACRIVDGDAAGESVYYGMACRMAQLLDLPNRACETRLERETNIRIWHTLVMIDEWSSSGVNIPRQISQPPNDIPLPMEEMAYLSLRQHDASNPLDTQGPISLLGQMIVLNNIFKQVNQLNVKAAQDQDNTSRIVDVQELTIQLDAWEASLPDYMRDTPSNLAHYAAQGLGRIFAAVYLGIYHYGQLLMYQFLHHDASNNPTTSHFSQRCKTFAEKLCNMVYAALDTPGCDVLYNMVGHILVIASTVQIHTLLFADDSNEIAAARSRLERNYTILLRLRQLWPSLDFCMMRLKVFHRACTVSMETSFRLDDWMLRFLSEFAKPVDDRNGGHSSWAVGDISITPSSDFDPDSLAILLDTAPKP